MYVHVFISARMHSLHARAAFHTPDTRTLALLANTLSYPGRPDFYSAS